MSQEKDFLVVHALVPRFLHCQALANSLEKVDRLGVWSHQEQARVESELARRLSIASPAHRGVIDAVYVSIRSSLIKAIAESLCSKIARLGAKIDLQEKS